MKFLCEECKKEFERENFTAYKVCKNCYDKYWKDYCRYLDQQWKLQQAEQALYEEYQASYEETMRGEK